MAAGPAQPHDNKYIDNGPRTFSQVIVQQFDRVEFFAANYPERDARSDREQVRGMADSGSRAAVRYGIHPSSRV